MEPSGLSLCSQEPAGALWRFLTYQIFMVSHQSSAQPFAGGLPIAFCLMLFIDILNMWSHEEL
jgi:hypothetical protein